MWLHFYELSKKFERPAKLDANTGQIHMNNFLFNEIVDYAMSQWTYMHPPVSYCHIIIYKGRWYLAFTYNIPEWISVNLILRINQPSDSGTLRNCTYNLKEGKYITWYSEPINRVKVEGGVAIR